jgi:hypothetical protein
MDTAKADTTGCLWCGHHGPLQAGDLVPVVNPQISINHRVQRCPECREAMLDAQWPDRVARYKGREHPRRFRRSLWVIIYPVACAWCQSTNLDAYEINATIANPVSDRFKYDIYRCNICRRPSAVSYLGEVHTHRADQDRTYPSLWYLDPPANQAET